MCIVRFEVLYWAFLLIGETRARKSFASAPFVDESENAND